MLGHVYCAEQGDYGDAVERCINGLRLPEPISRDLNDPLYKNEVQTQVVSLLERNLRVCIRRTSPSFLHFCNHKPTIHFTDFFEGLNKWETGNRDSFTFRPLSLPDISFTYLFIYSSYGMEPDVED
jgi:hypothetical protein